MSVLEKTAADLDVGFGKIGRSFTRMAGAGFRARVIVYDPGKSEDESEQILQSGKNKAYSMTWAQRLKRVFAIEIEKCEKCGQAMVIKTTRWGKEFLACVGYPECKNARDLPSKAEAEAEAEGA